MTNWRENILPMLFVLGFVAVALMQFLPILYGFAVVILVVSASAACYYAS